MAVSTAVPSPLSKLEEQLTCAICLNLYTDPKILPCHHSFCQHCLEGLPLDSQGDAYFVTCPTCRHRTELPEQAGVTGFPPAFQLNQFKEIHSQMKKGADTQKVCFSHGKPLEIFCETCDQVICQHCTVRIHRDHEYDLVTDSYPKHCQELKSCLVPVKEKVDAVKNALTVLTERKNKIREQGEATKEEIHVMVEKIINVLRQSERQLTEKVQTITDGKLQVLSQQKTSAEKSLSSLKKCEECVEQSLKTDPQQVLMSKKQMMERMSQVTQQIKVEQFSPTVEADVEFIQNGKALTGSYIGEVKGQVPKQCWVYGCHEIVNPKNKDVHEFLNDIIIHKRCFVCRKTGCGKTLSPSDHMVTFFHGQLYCHAHRACIKCPKCWVYVPQRYCKKCGHL